MYIIIYKILLILLINYCTDFYAATDNATKPSKIYILVVY